MADPVPEQFVAEDQMDDAVHAGMWLFLATELMLFGGVFLVYAVYRINFPDAFAGASGKLHLGLGTLNTALLLTSSLCMALADRFCEARRRRLTLLLLALTVVLGAAFAGIKLYEWWLEYQDGLMPLRGLPFHYDGAQPRQARIFFYLYYLATGLHLAHLSIGLGLIAAMGFYAWRWRQPARVARRVAVAGLYWHFVDVVWVFLYPILYLV